MGSARWLILLEMLDPNLAPVRLGTMKIILDETQRARKAEALAASRAAQDSQPTLKDPNMTNGKPPGIMALLADDLRQQAPNN